jgi:hypothetical protein
MKKVLLSDKDLLTAYQQAKKINLDKDFISLLEKEIKRRNPSFIKNLSKKKIDSQS